MPSPFPGMDPYLERHWRDVHASLVIYIRDTLQDILPTTLRARVEERVVLESFEGQGHSPFSHGRESESPRPRYSSPGASTALLNEAATEPVVIDVMPESVTEGYVEIIDASSGNRIITIIEVLSLANKTPGIGMQNYLRKQGEICHSQTNLVEIDLLRAGRHIVAAPLESIPLKLRTLYLACVRRATAPSKAELYPIALPAKLPTLSIPLRANDDDVPLDLQTLIERCYRKGRYEGDINYYVDADPPLTGADAHWAAELLRDKGFRATDASKKKRHRPPHQGH